MKIKKRIVSRQEHLVSRDAISDNALKVLYRLKDAGYQAYLVGGGVRDLLLGEKPKDFDVATDAHPDEVKGLFRNCRLIGRRFRLAHILYGRDVIEVATFRGPHEGESTTRADQNKEGRITRDNVFGSLEEDALRRDFSINALYYNIRDDSIVDFTGGMDDLQHKMIRMIGDTQTRYREDPVRMLRAVRFAAKLNFQMEHQTNNLIFELGDLLEDIPVARLFDETLKMFQGGYGLRCFQLLREYRLFELLFPMTEASINLSQDDHSATLQLIEQALINTDARIATGKSVNPAFFLAVLLWHPMHEYKHRFIERGQHEMEALLSASREVIIRQQAHTSIPKRLSLMMREIWHMQPQLQHPTRKRALRTLANKRFRAGYDFLLLRNKVDEPELTPLCEWWTEIQTKKISEQEAMCESLTRPQKKSGKRKRRRRKKTVTHHADVSSANVGSSE
ncbi:MAG: polynucleotide adenylyltransferase PcnB [gamma proteobacterium symbiont of Bathyaustriella thionipta]|nr:polynucleotide adenylyltransferase PcnB [gamma proteobacterium symbiont of Bathyaustriella thionipta]MCU7948636.1 polynucleotide adenylyltransferase PcnB [gamma proteobacterium symbiont of Bathyaustriella thionipta]MCU7953042.1 polynucleotide adenylyltransferase PcnB [gamma proteobacterium symbiont of Bathyaustriella thionipta]MCU7955358.1 polynucleotide adenylyltransferase PcnB [gamma proteobacterium symbiont of Bathyaustriella thionipta]MCU7967516.1 polynucleotide adenylyltransferase PcnB 